MFGGGLNVQRQNDVRQTQWFKECAQYAQTERGTPIGGNRQLRRIATHEHDRGPRKPFADPINKLELCLAMHIKVQGNVVWINGVVVKLEFGGGGRGARVKTGLYGVSAYGTELGW